MAHSTKTQISNTLSRIQQRARALRDATPGDDTSAQAHALRAEMDEARRQLEQFIATQTRGLNLSEGI